MAVNINVPSQVKTYANLAAFPATGALKTIYIAEDTNKTYRWTGSVYVEVSASAASGITIGSTAIASGVVGRVLFEGAGNVVQQSSSLFWDNTNNRLGIGTSSPAYQLSLSGTANIQGATGINLLVGTRGVFFGLTSATDVSTYLATSPLIFSLNQGITPVARFAPTTGNFLINTTTDAGFRLDVNGTARVSGNAQFGTGFYWDNTNSRVGVGTSSPRTNISIVGANDSSPVLGSANGKFTVLNGPTNGTYGLVFGVQGSGISHIQSQRVDGSATAYALAIQPAGGNVLINTTTDAGFRLDVNGTARVQGAVTLSAASPSITLGGDLTITSTLYPSRVASYDILNSNLNLIAGGFGEGMFIGNRLTGSRTSTTFVSPDGLNAVGSAYISPYLQSNGNVIIRASNNGNRSIQLTGLGGSGSVLIGNITTGNGTQYSSILTLESTTQGFLPPRMTTTQKNAIASPAAGLMVYDTTLNVISYYNGSMWI